jgi:hypothetical protein
MQKMHMFSKVPPLEPGETEIVTMEGGASPAPSPALLLQRAPSPSSMRVNFIQMSNNGTLHNGQVDLAMVQMAATDTMDSSWTKMVTEVDGEMRESEASCIGGKFSCQGDATWCLEQKELVCKGSQSMSLRQCSHKQGHLQA